ncbi:MAG TPA: cation-translocating P-type ATPase C-terminal domain-containing protein, partial [Alphaproteobacteria bacterium]|nr:cation-translocating P-type ATPase C-terminal domain-containing protein [Alphaproteobacteria bacterium]
VAFMTYGLARLWHVFNMRSPESHWLRNNVVASPFVWGAVAICILLLLAALYFPPLASLLSLVPLVSFWHWGLALGASLVPFVVGQVAIQVLAQRGLARVS